MTTDDLSDDENKDFDTASNNNAADSDTSESIDSVRNTKANQANIKSNNNNSSNSEDDELLKMASGKILEYFTDQYSSPYIAVNIQGHIVI